MDYDESFTCLYYASRPLSAGISDYSLPNNHLFHTLLVHLSTQLLGNHPWTVRLRAFRAGVALVPATCFWIRRVFNGSAALLAAALVASSEPLVAYSTNARGYALLGLFFVLAFTFAARAIDANRPADWIVFVVVSTAGFYAIPTMVYGFGSIALWAGVRNPNRRSPSGAPRADTQRRFRHPGRSGADSRAVRADMAAIRLRSLEGDGIRVVGLAPVPARDSLVARTGLEGMEGRDSEVRLDGSRSLLCRGRNPASPPLRFGRKGVHALEAGGPEGRFRARLPAFRNHLARREPSS